MNGKEFSAAYCKNYASLARSVLDVIFLSYSSVHYELHGPPYIEQICVSSRRNWLLVDVLK